MTQKPCYSVLFSYLFVLKISVSMGFLQQRVPYSAILKVTDELLKETHAIGCYGGIHCRNTPWKCLNVVFYSFTATHIIRSAVDSILSTPIPYNDRSFLNVVQTDHCSVCCCAGSDHGVNSLKINGLTS
jgi:hypothetical protein